MKTKPWNYIIGNAALIHLARTKHAVRLESGPSSGKGMILIDQRYGNLQIILRIQARATALAPLKMVRSG